MPRIRTIKPEFFLHEGLADLPLIARMLFIGLWTQADREGRLEDRPKRLKASIFPYDDCDVNELLDLLAQNGFLVRYKVDELLLIQIINFTKHQVCNVREQASTLPPQDGKVPVQYKHSTSTVQALQEGKGKEEERELEGNEEEERGSGGKRVAAVAASDEKFFEVEVLTLEIDPLPDEEKKESPPVPAAPPLPDDPEPKVSEQMMAAYFEFYKGRIGLAPKIDGADGKALKTIAAHFKSISKEKDDRGALAGMKWLFEHWQDLEPFHQGQLKLTQINSNLNNLIAQIKKGNGKTTGKSISGNGLKPNGIRSDGRSGGERL